MASRFEFRTLLLSLLIAFAADAWATPDVTLDNHVDVVDVQLTVNLILSLAEPVWPGQGNVNGDATRDVVDVQLIVNEILGLSGGPLSIPDPGPVLEIPVGIAWSRHIFALGGTRPRVFSLGPGAPAWLSVTPDGLLQGTPAAVGPHPFLLRVTAGTSTVSRVMALTVTNQPPVVENEIIHVPAGTMFVSTLAGVLANDFDPDGHSLTATQVMTPSVGTLSLMPSGYFSLAVPASADGILGFAYSVSDGFGGVTLGSVKVIVLESSFGAARADAILMPEIAPQGASVRVTTRIRAPQGQTVSGVVATVEDTLQLVQLLPRTHGTPSASTAVYGGELTTAGLAAGIHRVVITASLSGGGSTQTKRRFSVFTGTPIRVGVGGYQTLSEAGAASLEGDVVLLDPGLYQGSGNGTLPGKHLGIVGCAHGAHAARLQIGTSSALFVTANEYRRVQGVTFIQATALAISATTSGSRLGLLNCRFEGAPLQQSVSPNTAITTDSSAVVEIVGCEFVDWWRATASGSGDIQAGAITLRTSSRLVVDDCYFIRCRNVNSSTSAAGGAIAVIGTSGSVRTVRADIRNSTFVECSIQGSVAGYGGAIGVTWGSITVTDCTFVGNFCRSPSTWGTSTSTSLGYFGGGAIAARSGGVATIHRCQFIDNAVSVTRSASPTTIRCGGGALFSTDNSSMVVDQSHFEGNRAFHSLGSGTYVRGSVAVVQRSSALRFEHSTLIGNGLHGADSVQSSLLAVDGPDRQTSFTNSAGSALQILNVLAVENGAGASGHFVIVEKSTPTSTAIPPSVTVHHSTYTAPIAVAWAFPIAGATISAEYGALQVRDSIVWVPTIPAVEVATGTTAQVTYCCVGPTAMLGTLTAGGNPVSDPLLSSSTSWLLPLGSPAINAGSSSSPVSFLLGRSAMSDLQPDSGIVDIGFHAPIPSFAPFPLTTTDGYTLGHQLSLHAGYSSTP